MRRQESFPWIIVMGGAVLYWTIALGIGIPSLYRAVGGPGPARRAPVSETRCVQAATVDGTPVVFGDCINVRFLLDAPSLSVDQEHAWTYRRAVPARHDRVMAGPDPEIHEPVWNPTPHEHPRRESVESPDSIGRTSF